MMNNGSSSSRGRVVKSSARNRREKENNEFSELCRLLPLPYAITCQLDKASVIRLTTSYLSLRKVFPHEYRSACSNDNRACCFVDGRKCPELQEVASHLMQTLDGFVFVLAADGRIMYISETASVHLGLSQVELTGNFMYDYIHSNDSAELANILNGTNVTWDCALGAEDVEVERMFFLRMKCVLAKRNAGLCDSGYKVIHCSGYSRFRRCNGLEPLPFGSRDMQLCEGVQSLGLIAVGYTLPTTAVTEIRLSAFMFMFRASLDLKIVFLDSRAVDLTGFDAKQMLDKSLYELTHAADADVLKKAHKAVLSKHQVTTAYYRVLAADGGWVWAQSQLILIHVPRASRPNCIVGITSVLSNAETVDMPLYTDIHNQGGQTAIRRSLLADSKQKVSDTLGSYSESYYGPNGMHLVDKDTCRSVIEGGPFADPREARHSQVTEDPISGEKRYRLRLPVISCAPPLGQS